MDFCLHFVSSLNRKIVNHDMKKTILTARESFEMQEGKGEGGCYSWIMASCFFPDATNRKEVWQPEWLTKGIVGKWLANYNFWETGHFISSGSNCYSSPFALGTPPEHSLSVSLHQRKLGSTLNFLKPLTRSKLMNQRLSRWPIRRSRLLAIGNAPKSFTPSDFF